MQITPTNIIHGKKIKLFIKPIKTFLAFLVLDQSIGEKMCACEKSTPQYELSLFLLYIFSY